MPRLSPAIVRARRIARKVLSTWAWPVNSPSPIAAVAAALLAERKAAAAEERARIVRWLRRHSNLRDNGADFAMWIETGSPCSQEEGP